MENNELMFFTVVNINFYGYFASNLNLKNLNILRSKVTKNLTNLLKKFCESPPWHAKYLGSLSLLVFVKLSQKKVM